MSDADNEVVVTTAGVTARKTLDADRFDHPTVVIGLHADTESPVRIRLTDRTPADWTPEDVRFDPEYGADHWAVDDGTLVFERVLQPGRRYTTLYNVRDAPLGEPLAYEPDLAVDPAEEATAGTAASEPDEGAAAGGDDPDGPEGLEGLVSASDNDPVRGVIAGDRDSLTDGPETVETETEGAGNPDDAGRATAADAGTEGGDERTPTAGDATDDADTTAAPEPTPAVVSVDGGDGAGEDGADGGPPDPDSGTDDPASGTGGGGISTEAREAAAGERAGTGGDGDGAAEPEAEPTATGDDGDDGGAGTEADTPSAATDQPEGGVARVLAKELREDRVSDADRELLREELGVGPERTERTESTEARIRHLQNEVSDLSAYTDALEAFIDEQGTADQVLDGLDDRVADVEDRVQGFEDGLADLRDDLVALETDLRGEVRSVTTDVDDLETTVADLESRVEAADASEAVAAVESDIEDLRDDVDDLAEFRAELTTTLSQLTGGFGDAGED